jgi:hypothetical protein
LGGKLVGFGDGCCSMIGARTKNLVGKVVSSARSIASLDVSGRDGCAVDDGLGTCWFVDVFRAGTFVASKMLLGRFGARLWMLYDADVERVR